MENFLELHIVIFLSVSLLMYQSWLLFKYSSNNKNSFGWIDIGVIIGSFVFFNILFYFTMNVRVYMIFIRTIGVIFVSLFIALSKPVYFNFK